MVITLVITKLKQELGIIVLLMMVVFSPIINTHMVVTKDFIEQFLQHLSQIMSLKVYNYGVS
jgi:hypothetical protein